MWLFPKYVSHKTLLCKIGGFEKGGASASVNWGHSKNLSGSIAEIGVGGTAGHVSKDSMLPTKRFVICYLDDMLTLSAHEDSFKDHLDKVRVMLDRLHEVGMKVNLHMTEFFKSTLDYLGCTLTPSGISPQTKKVEGIQRLLPPTNRHQLRRFLHLRKPCHLGWPL